MDSSTPELQKDQTDTPPENIIQSQPARVVESQSLPDYIISPLPKAEKTDRGIQFWITNVFPYPF